MPVLTPSRASTETVNAVSNGDSFLAAIRSRPSSSQRSGVSARQISPRPSLAMKLIASGVANWAAIVRSPSFSRSSSSTTTTIRPSRISSIASSIVANRALTAMRRRLAREQLLDVLGEHVRFEVHVVAGPELSERRRRERVRNQSDLEAAVVDRRHRQARPLHGDRPLLDDVAQELGRGVEGHPPAVPLVFHAAN